MGKVTAGKGIDFSNKTVWYVLANRTEAVIYADSKEKHFHFVERMKNNKGKRMETDLVSDKEGRSSSSAGNGTIRHSFEPKITHHEYVAKKFAQVVAASLTSARREDRFGSLVLVAEPHFLGLLRSELDPAVKKAITHELKHEYRQGSDARLQLRIKKALEKESA